MRGAAWRQTQWDGMGGEKRRNNERQNERSEERSGARGEGERTANRRESNAEQRSGRLARPRRVRRGRTTRAEPSRARANAPPGSRSRPPPASPPGRRYACNTTRQTTRRDRHRPMLEQSETTGISCVTTPMHVIEPLQCKKLLNAIRLKP